MIPIRYYQQFYINVADKMKEKDLFPKPKVKSKFIYNDGEFLPLITVSCGLWSF